MMRLPEHEYLTVAEAATAINRSTTTVWRYARARRLRRIKRLGRTYFRRQDIEKLLNAEG